MKKLQAALVLIAALALVVQAAARAPAVAPKQKAARCNRTRVKAG